MKATKSVLLNIAVVLLLFSCSKESTQQSPNALDPSEYFEKKDVSYGADKYQKFDLYLPANRSMATKVLILVHGGGWSAGDKTELNDIKDFLRQDLPEVAVVNMNYRLADAENNPYPMQLDDITTVIDHLRLNASDYVISHDYGFLGVSAGAHLSLLWSYAFDVKKEVKMVCSIVGPTNFMDPFYFDTTDPNIKNLLNLFGEEATIDFLKNVSPYYKVTASAPPTLLFYGKQDPLVPVSQATMLKERLQQLGVPHDYTLYENGGHGWIGPELLDTAIKLQQFVQTYL